MTRVPFIPGLKPRLPCTAFMGLKTHAPSGSCTCLVPDWTRNESGEDRCFPTLNADYAFRMGHP